MFYTRKKSSKEDLEKISLLIQSVEARVTDKEFCEKIKDKMISFDISTVQLVGNTIEGIDCITKKPQTLTITVRDQFVKFEYTNPKRIESGEVVLSKEGQTYIKYNCKETSVYKNIKVDGKGCCHSFNISNNQVIHYFNANGIEIFRYKEEEHENFYIHKKTKEKILHEVSPFKNRIEKDYVWRASANALIARNIKKYNHPDIEDNHDSYLISNNVNPKSARIPYSGYFVWIDKILYKMFRTGRCDISYLFENCGKKYVEKVKTI